VTEIEDTVASNGCDARRYHSIDSFFIRHLAFVLRLPGMGRMSFHEESALIVLT
jgi:hypothetical protein